MFENIASKIKTMAGWIFGLGLCGTILLGLTLMSQDVLFGVVVIIIGVLSSLIIPYLIYGFGQLIENSDYIAKKISTNATEDKKPEDK